jgi:hypothetical protein
MSAFFTIGGMTIGRELKGVSEAPPEFDMHRAKLNVVEIQVYPGEFRMALSRDWDGLIYFKRTEEGALESLNRLIQKHGIMDLPPRMPLKIFRKFIARCGISSMRLQIEYKHGDWCRNWQCRYVRMDKLPANVRAFYDDCFKVAITTSDGGKKRKMSRDELANFPGKGA